MLSQPAIRVLNRSLLPWRLWIAEPGGGTNPVLQSPPGRELGATIKGDRLACLGGQGGEPRDQCFHDRLGVAILIAHDNGKSADPLDQGGDIHLAVFLAEHHQIALPVAELLALGNGRRPVTQALAVLNVTTLISSVVSRPATSALLRQVAIEGFLKAKLRVSEAVDRFMADADAVVLKPHSASNLFRRPTRLERILDRCLHLRVGDQLPVNRTAALVLVLSSHRIVAAILRELGVLIRVPLYLPVNCRWRAREPICDFRHRHLAFPPFGNLSTFFKAQV